MKFFKELIRRSKQKMTDLEYRLCALESKINFCKNKLLEKLLQIKLIHSLLHKERFKL